MILAADESAVAYPEAVVSVTTIRPVEFGYVRLFAEGRFSVAEIGRQAMFHKRCLDRLLAFSKSGLIIIQLDCQDGLCESGCLQMKSENGKIHSVDFEMTQKGWDRIACFDVGDHGT